MDEARRVSDWEIANQISYPARRGGWRLFLPAAVCSALVFAVSPSRAADESLGDKIKKVLAPTPTPTPRHKHHKRRSSAKKATPTPTPSPQKKEKRKATPSPTESPTPSVTPKAGEETASPSPSESPGKAATNASISPNELKGYDDYPAPVRKLVASALELTKRDLTYTYGSADPANGGMDCSGFIYYILRENAVADVPRSSSEQYVWVRKANNFRAVLSRHADTFELDALKPGDLLFWTGTYQIERDPPVTHTMIYLGREKESGKRVMVGSSDGRTYEGKARWGVSVFDFKLAKPTAADAKLHPVFVGYGSIPGLGKER
jgi:cell wall-associated NlpC family hydrolase